MKRLLVIPILLLSLLVGNPAFSAGNEPLQECEKRLNNNLKFPSTYKRLGYEKTSKQCNIYPTDDGWGIIVANDEFGLPPMPSKNIYLPSLEIMGKCSDSSNTSPKRKYLSYIVKVEYSAKTEDNETKLGVFECIVNYRLDKKKGVLNYVIGNNLSFSSVYYKFRY